MPGAAGSAMMETLADESNLKTGPLKLKSLVDRSSILPKKAKRIISRLRLILQIDVLATKVGTLTSLLQFIMGKLKQVYILKVCGNYPQIVP